MESRTFKAEGILKKYMLLSLVILSGCRKDAPPAIENCVHDKFGGARCVEVDGTRKYRPPSELGGRWSTNNDDFVKWSSWCYEAKPAEVEAFLKAKKEWKR